MLKDIVVAIQSYFRAHQLIKQHKLWRYVLIPGILYTLLFLCSMYFFGQSASAAVSYMGDLVNVGGWMQKLQETWFSFLITLGGVIVWIILMLAYFSLFKYGWLILGSPLFAYLSEKTESIIDGKNYPFNLKLFLKDSVRGMAISLRNSFWQLLYTISLLLLSFVPVVGFLAPLLMLMTEFYYYGFSMLDYSCERKRMTIAESIYYIGQHRGLAVGNGMVFYIMHLLPVVGWIFAPAYAVVAATVSLNPVPEKKSSTSFTIKKQ